MSLPSSLNGREYNKFVEYSIGKSGLAAVPVQNRSILLDFESITGLTGSTDVTNIATNRNHREGSKSLSFDKSGTTQAFGSITKVLAEETGLNLIGFEQGALRFYINLSDITNVASVALQLGSNSSNYTEWLTAVGSLSTGWNTLTVTADAPTSSTGEGVPWGSVHYISIVVNFNAAANQLNTILVDSLSAIFQQEVKLSGSLSLSSSVSIKDGSSANLASVDASGRFLTRVTDTAGASVTVGQKAMAASLPVVIASNQTAIPVSSSPPASPYTPTNDQVVIAVTNTAIALGTSGTQVKVLVKAHILNGAEIVLGDSSVTTADGYRMEQGASEILENVDLSTIFINGTAGDGVSIFNLA